MQPKNTHVHKSRPCLGCKFGVTPMEVLSFLSVPQSLGWTWFYRIACCEGDGVSPARTGYNGLWLVLLVLSFLALLTAGFDNSIVSCPTERPTWQETECGHRSTAHSERNLANSLMKRYLPSWVLKSLQLQLTPWVKNPAKPHPDSWLIETRW